MEKRSTLGAELTATESITATTTATATALTKSTTAATLNTGSFAVTPAEDGLHFYVINDGATAKVSFLFDLRECPERNILRDFFNIPSGKQLIIPDTHGNTLLQEWFRVGFGLAEYTPAEWERKVAIMRFNEEFSSGLGDARMKKFSEDLFAFQKGASPCPNQLPSIADLEASELSSINSIFAELLCAELLKKLRNDLMPAIELLKNILNNEVSFADQCAALQAAVFSTLGAFSVAPDVASNYLTSQVDSSKVASLKKMLISRATAIMQNAELLQSFVNWVGEIANAPITLLSAIIAQKKKEFADTLHTIDKECKDFMLQQLEQLEQALFVKINIPVDPALDKFYIHINNSFMVTQLLQTTEAARARLFALINKLTEALTFDGKEKFDAYCKQFTNLVEYRVRISKTLYPERATANTATAATTAAVVEAKEADSNSDSNSNSDSDSESGSRSGSGSESKAECASASAFAFASASVAAPISWKQHHDFLEQQLTNVKSLFAEIQSAVPFDPAISAQANEILQLMRTSIAEECEYAREHPSFIDYNIYAAHVKSTHQLDKTITTAAHFRGQRARRQAGEPEYIQMIELDDGRADRGERDFSTISNLNIAKKYGLMPKIIFSNHGGYAMDFFRFIDEHIAAQFNALQRRISGTIDVAFINAKINMLEQQFAVAESRLGTAAKINAWWWDNVKTIFSVDHLFDVIFVLQPEIDFVSSASDNPRIIQLNNILNAAKKLLCAKYSLPDAKMACNNYPSTMSLYAWLLAQGESHTNADGFYTEEFLQTYKKLRAEYKSAFVDNLVVAESQPGGVFVTHAPGIALVERDVDGVESVNQHKAHLCWARGWSLVLLKGMERVIAFYDANYLTALQSIENYQGKFVQDNFGVSNQYIKHYFSAQHERLSGLVKTAALHHEILREFLAPEDTDRLNKFLLVTDAQTRAAYAAAHPYENDLPHYHNYGVAVLKKWVDCINASFRLLAAHSLIATKDMDFAEMSQLPVALSIQEEVGFFSTIHGREFASIDVRTQTACGRDPLAIFNKPLAGAAGSGWIPGGAQKYYTEHGRPPLEIVSMHNIHGHEPYQPGQHGADGTGGMANKSNLPINLNEISAPGNPVMEKSMFVVPTSFNFAAEFTRKYLQEIDNAPGKLSVALMQAILTDIADGAPAGSRSLEARSDTLGDVSMVDLEADPQRSYPELSAILGAFATSVYSIAQEHKREFDCIQEEVNSSPGNVAYHALIAELDKNKNKELFLLIYNAFQTILNHPHVSDKTKSLVALTIAAQNPRDSAYIKYAKRIYAAINAAKNPASNALAFIQDIKLMALIFISGGTHVAYMFGHEAGTILLAGKEPEHNALYRAMVRAQNDAAFQRRLNGIVLAGLNNPQDPLAQREYPASTNCQVAVTPFLILSSITFTLLVIRTWAYSIANGYDDYLLPASEAITGVPAIILIAAYPYFAFGVLLWNRQNPNAKNCRSLITCTQKTTPGGIHSLPVSFYFNFPMYSGTLIIFGSFVQYIVDSFPEIFGANPCDILNNITHGNFTTLDARYGSPCHKYNYEYWAVPILGLMLTITKIIMHNKFATPLSPELQFAPREFFLREIEIRMPHGLRHFNNFLNAIYHCMSVLLVLAGLFEWFYNSVTDWYTNKYLIVFATLAGTLLFAVVKASLKDTKATIILTHLTYIFAYIYFQFKFYDAFVVNHFPIDWVDAYDGSLVGNVAWVFVILMTAARLYAVFLGIGGGLQGSEKAMLDFMAAAVRQHVTAVIHDHGLVRRRAKSLAAVQPDPEAESALFLAANGNAAVVATATNAVAMQQELLGDNNDVATTDVVVPVPAKNCCALFRCGGVPKDPVPECNIDVTTTDAITEAGLFAAIEHTFAGVMIGARGAT